MRLAVINHWYDKKSAVFWNKDGFLRMLQVLRDRDGWEVKFFKKHDKTFEWIHDYVNLHFSSNPAEALKNWKPDAILFFCDGGSPVIKELEDYKVPKALCYTGGRFKDYLKLVDIIFVESKAYVDWMRGMGLNVVQAFGTNTELFKPIEMPKFWEGIFPATGAAWKRHWLFAEAMMSRGLVCGWWQEHEPECLEVCKKWRTGILHHQMPESLVYLYNMSHTCVITSSDIGGSQRTVLEALACNIPTIVMADSTMTAEYIRECGQGEIVEPNAPDIRNAVERLKYTKTTTRDWVLKNYSEFVYADKIKKGLNEVSKSN